MPKKYPLVQKEAVRLEFSRAVEEKLFLDFFE
jgi:hypothetical protein